MKRARTVVLMAIGLAATAGCGGRKPTTEGAHDHPEASAPEADAPGLTTTRSFDVVATLSAVPRDGGFFFATIPPTIAFTVTLDVDKMRALVGGGGVNGVVPLERVDGHTFRTTERFAVGAMNFGCTGLVDVAFRSATFVVGGDTLSGQAQGDAEAQDGDFGTLAPVTATLAGTADVTPPSLIWASLVTTVDPLNGFRLAAAEPLALASKARLVAPDGTAIDLVPQPLLGETELGGFSKPAVVLRYGISYTVDGDGLVDLAGNKGAGQAPLRVSALPTPPLVAEDGFESLSAADGPVGGAGVVQSGTLAPLSGARSLYVAAAGSVAQAEYKSTGTMVVRLALQPGDKTLHLSYRVVPPNNVGFPGLALLQLGSVGKTPGTIVSLAAGSPAPEDAGSGATVMTKDVPIPADAADELIVEIATVRPPGPPCTIPMLPSGVLLDELRVD